MKIHSLGHSSFILEMGPAVGAEPVRILFDPWLSDYSVGDLMGRFPRIRFEVADLAPIHAIYLTHGHTDHFDPETLLRLWRGLFPKPEILLPETIACLAPLLGKYLPGAEPTIVRFGHDHDFRGLDLGILGSRSQHPTNEDDVGILFARTGREAFMNECDCLLPLDESMQRLAVRDWLDLYTNEESGPPETACFVTTRNELDASMSVLAATDVENRAERIDWALDETCEGIHDLYAPLEAEEEVLGAERLWNSPQLVRLVGGQGLCHPHELDADRNRTMFPIRIADRVRLEREIAANYGCRLSIEELKAGETHVVEGGRLAERRAMESIEVLDREEDRFFDPDRPVPGDFPDAPLREETRDEGRQLAMIRDALSRRFLPFLASTTRITSISTALSREPYRIRFLFTEGRPRELRITFDTMRFVEVEPGDDPDEVYWANDIEDFLDGRCDEFSRYCRRPAGGQAQSFWRCLGLPFLNNDLVEKKLRLHFERAARGETNREWVHSFHA